MSVFFFFFFQAEDGIRDVAVTGVQTCALPICRHDLVAEPDVRVLANEERVPKQIEVLTRLTTALQDVLDLVLHVVDAERGVYSCCLECVERALPPAGDLADEVEILL